MSNCHKTKKVSKVTSLIESCYIFHWLLLISALQGLKGFVCVCDVFFTDFSQIFMIFRNCSWKCQVLLVGQKIWSHDLAQMSASKCTCIQLLVNLWYSPQIHAHHFDLMHKNWEIIMRCCWVRIFEYFLYNFNSIHKCLVLFRVRICAHCPKWEGKR